MKSVGSGGIGVVDGLCCSIDVGGFEVVKRSVGFLSARDIKSFLVVIAM